MTNINDLRPGDIVRINHMATGRSLHGALASVVRVVTDTGVAKVEYHDGERQRSVHLWPFKLDFVARPEPVAPEKYQEGDAFPNVGYVRRLLGVERVGTAV